MEYVILDLQKYMCAVKTPKPLSDTDCFFYFAVENVSKNCIMHLENFIYKRKYRYLEKI